MTLNWAPTPVGALFLTPKCVRFLSSACPFSFERVRFLSSGVSVFFRARVRFLSRQYTRKNIQERIIQERIQERQTHGLRPPLRFAPLRTQPLRPSASVAVESAVDNPFWVEEVPRRSSSFIPSRIKSHNSNLP